MKKLNFTLMELSIVLSILAILTFFSLLLFPNFNFQQNLPFNFYWENFSKIEFKCDTNNYCNKVEICELSFSEWFLEELDSKWGQIDEVWNWKFDISNYETLKCKEKKYKVNLKIMSDELSNQWIMKIYILNWILYDENFSKIHWIIIRWLNLRIIDWIIYYN